MKRDRALLTIGRLLVSAFVGACFAAMVSNDWSLSVFTFGVVSVATYVWMKRIGARLLIF